MRAYERYNVRINEPYVKLLEREIRNGLAIFLGPPDGHEKTEKEHEFEWIVRSYMVMYNPFKEIMTTFVPKCYLRNKDLSLDTEIRLVNQWKRNKKEKDLCKILNKRLLKLLELKQPTLTA